MWLCMLNFIRVPSAIDELLPFHCLNFNFSAVGHNFVSNGWNLMKLILNIYDYGVVMHVRFHQGVICYGELLPFDFFHPQPKLSKQ